MASARRCSNHGLRWPPRPSHGSDRRRGARAGHRRDGSGTARATPRMAARRPARPASRRVLSGSRTLRPACPPEAREGSAWTTMVAAPRRSTGDSSARCADSSKMPDDITRTAAMAIAAPAPRTAPKRLTTMLTARRSTARPPAASCAGPPVRDGSGRCGRAWLSPQQGLPSRRGGVQQGHPTDGLRPRGLSARSQVSATPERFGAPRSEAQLACPGIHRVGVLSTPEHTRVEWASTPEQALAQRGSGKSRGVGVDPSMTIPPRGAPHCAACGGTICSLQSEGVADASARPVESIGSRWPNGVFAHLQFPPLKDGAALTVTVRAASVAQPSVELREVLADGCGFERLRTPVGCQNPRLGPTTTSGQRVRISYREPLAPRGRGLEQRPAHPGRDVPRFQ